MIKISSKEICNGCYACANSCPKKCIEMISDEEGFWYPQIDKEKCVDCGICDKVCPIKHKWQPNDNSTTSAFAAINLNEEIRLKSSSGGIFTLIAEEILRQGGVVFGAAFTDDFRAVHHIFVDSAVDLDKLRGSKYVQSKIGDSYIQAKKFLDCGRKVLFTGTPCQIGGLYSFLRKPYKNLYTQDIICHGVPSPMVWEKYVDERERKAASKTERMFFRHKKYGWKTYVVLFEFSNNTTYIKNLQKDSFMRAFLSDLCLRPSCYSCSFKTIQRQADITLADFWGVQKVMPKMDDDNGTSLVFVHSDKGKELMNASTSQIRQESVDISVASKYNPSVVKSCGVNKNRTLFLKEIVMDDFEKTVRKYTKQSYLKSIRRILSKVKHMIIRQ